VLLVTESGFCFHTPAVDARGFDNEILQREGEVGEHVLNVYVKQSQS